MLAYTSVLNSNALDNWSALIEASDKHQIQVGVRAGLRLRAGDYLGALELLPPDRANFLTRTLAFVAMAEHFVGHAVEVREALAECQKRVEEEASGMRITDDWHGLLAGRLLFEEAKQLINASAP